MKAQTGEKGFPGAVERLPGFLPERVGRRGIPIGLLADFVEARQSGSSVGYASSSLFGVHFGTGQRKEIERIDIRWPSGIRQTLRNVKTNQVLQVQEPVRDQSGGASDARKR